MQTQERERSKEAPPLLLDHHSGGIERAARALPLSLTSSASPIEAVNKLSEADGSWRATYTVLGAPLQASLVDRRAAALNPIVTDRSDAEDISDELLLMNVAKGDKAAMHILFARHRERVLRFIIRLVRNPGIAEDIVSQVFLDVWRSANKFENRARVSTWLLSIARFKAFSSLRQRRHENIDQPGVLEIVDEADTPDVAVDRSQAYGILHRCLEGLSPAHREIIDLFYFREHPVAEVSRIAGISEATVKSRLFYARKQLAKVVVSAGLEASSDHA